MNPTTALVLTGGVVIVGHLVQDKRVPIKVFVGIGITAIVVSGLAEANAKLGQQFALLLLVAAMMIYGPPIATALKGLK